MSHVIQRWFKCQPFPAITYDALKRKRHLRRLPNTPDFAVYFQQAKIGPHLLMALAEASRSQQKPAQGSPGQPRAVFSRPKMNTVELRYSKLLFCEN